MVNFSELTGLQFMGLRLIGDDGESRESFDKKDTLVDANGNIVYSPADSACFKEVERALEDVVKTGSRSFGGGSVVLSGGPDSSIGSGSFTCRGITSVLRDYKLEKPRFTKTTQLKIYKTAISGAEKLSDEWISIMRLSDTATAMVKAGYQKEAEHLLGKLASRARLMVVDGGQRSDSLALIANVYANAGKVEGAKTLFNEAIADLDMLVKRGEDITRAASYVTTQVVNSHIDREVKITLIDQLSTKVDQMKDPEAAIKALCDLALILEEARLAGAPLKMFEMAIVKSKGIPKTPEDQYKPERLYMSCVAAMGNAGFTERPLKLINQFIDEICTSQKDEEGNTTCVTQKSDHEAGEKIMLAVRTIVEGRFHENSAFSAREDTFATYKKLVFASACLKEDKLRADVIVSLAPTFPFFIQTGVSKERVWDVYDSLAAEADKIKDPNLRNTTKEFLDKFAEGLGEPVERL